ncbi:hypothetical protein D3C85_1473030 [compost metagenome]
MCLTWQLGLKRFWQQRSEQLACHGQSLEYGWAWNYGAQALAQHTFSKSSGYLLLNESSADVEKIVILHTRRTSGFAVATGQAAVKMLLCLGGDFLPF